MTNLPTILGICTSLKPAPGHEGRSAARSLLTMALDSLFIAYPACELLDLRDFPPPLFDGRGPSERTEPNVTILVDRVSRAAGLLIAVPAYWSAVSGVFKTFIEVLCGAAYDQTDQQTVFRDKPVGLIVVGTDEESTSAGAEQARAILRHTGAIVIEPIVKITNPRHQPLDAHAVTNEMALVAALVSYAALTAAHA